MCSSDLVNKWDRLRGVASRQEYEEALWRAVPFLAFAPAVFVSAATGWNVSGVIETLARVAAAVAQPLPTGPLNRCLLDAYTRKAPPLIGGKRWKLYYAAQVGTNPQRIILFVNDPQRLPAAYESYLFAAIRRKFELPGAPLQFILKPRIQSKPVFFKKDT